MEAEFLRYYEDLLVTDSDADNYVSNAIINEGIVISLSQQHELCASFSSEDVKAALFDMDEGKAAGPDRYSSGFFRKAWSCVGYDIVVVVLVFFSDGKVIKTN